MFINISNHPSEKWSQLQKDAALRWTKDTLKIRKMDPLLGQIRDIPFPNVPPDAGPETIKEMAQELVKKIPEGTTHVLIQGEMTLTFRVVQLLKTLPEVTVVAACSRRIVEEEIQEDGTTRKKSVFKFVQFREYL